MAVEFVSSLFFLIYKKKPFKERNRYDKAFKSKLEKIKN